MATMRRQVMALLYVLCISATLFVVHHQLQVVYYRTCRVNLLAVVLHNRSDVCHGLNMAITAIERTYQQAATALMHWGVSVATILLPCVLSLSQAAPPLPALGRRLSASSPASAS